MKRGNLQTFWNDDRLEEKEERHRNSWMQEITTGIREKRINGMEWINKEKWRRKIRLKL